LKNSCFLWCVQKLLKSDVHSNLTKVVFLWMLRHVEASDWFAQYFIDQTKKKKMEALPIITGELDPQLAARVKTAIFVYSSELRMALRKLETALIVRNELEYYVPTLNNLTAILKELIEMGDIVPLTPVAVDRAPEGSDRLQAVKLLSRSEMTICNAMLTDLENKLPEIKDTQSLLKLIKMMRDVSNLGSQFSY